MRVLIHRTCSKSIAAVQALEAKGYIPEIILYREPGVLTDALLQEVQERLRQPLRAILRTKEDAAAGIDALADDALPAYVRAHPELLERPIVLARGAALVARPPREVWELVPEVSFDRRDEDTLPDALRSIPDAERALADTQGPYRALYADQTPVAIQARDTRWIAPGWEDLGLEKILEA